VSTIYPPQASLIADVTIESINVAPAVITEDTYEVPVSINWRVIA